jgi:hypothetical protein
MYANFPKFSNFVSSGSPSAGAILQLRIFAAQKVLFPSVIVLEQLGEDSFYCLVRRNQSFRQ